MSMPLVVQVWSLDLDKTSTILLMALCDIADDDGTNCYARADYICWKARVSPASFYRLTAALEARGILSHVDEPNGRTQWSIHLENAPKRKPFRRGKAGRPRNDTKDENRLSPRETISHSEKIVSHSEKIVSHSEKRGGVTNPGGKRDEGVKKSPILSPYPNSGSLTSNHTLLRVAPAPVVVPPTRGTPDGGADARESKSEKQKQKAEREAKRATLWRAMTDAGLPDPITRREIAAKNMACYSLLDANVQPNQIGPAVAAFHALWPMAVCTPLAIERNWSHLVKGPQDAAQIAVDESRRRDEARRQRERDDEAQRERDYQASRAAIAALLAECPDLPGETDASPGAAGALPELPGRRLA